MRHRYFAILFILALSLSTFLQSTAGGLAQDGANGGLEVWRDSRPSDVRLRGRDVVRRPQEELPEFKKSWILVIEGTKQAPGLCGYSLGFSEPAQEATPKVFLMTAVDPTTCEVEFTVGIPTNAEMPVLSGMARERSHDGSGNDGKSATYSLDAPLLGYLSPDALAQIRDSSDLSTGQQIEPEAIQLRYTVYAEWTDFLPGPGLVVNQVLSAVKARVDRQSSLSQHQCRHDRAWRVRSGWENRSGGDWGYENCNQATFSVKSTTSGRFKNGEFPACRIAGPAWVYYDRLSARAATGDSPHPKDWFFQYNIVSTWADGGGCQNLLRWSGFHTYPFDFNSLDHPI